MFAGQFVGSQFAGPYSGPPPFTSSFMGPFPLFSAGPRFGTHVSSSTVPGSSAMFPTVSAPLHFTLILEGLLLHQIRDMQGLQLHFLQLLTQLRRQWLAGVTHSLLIQAVLVDSLQVGNDFRLAAHSSPLVRFLLMDDKGGEERRIKAYLVCVCAVLMRVDVLS